MGILKGKGIWTLVTDVDTAVARAPQVGADFILCRVSTNGRYAPAKAIPALASVGTNPDLTPVAWMFNTLNNVDEEANCIRRALEDGFKAMILDAEAATNGKFSQAQALATRVTQMGLDTSRIYLCSDPRLDNKIDEIPVTVLGTFCRGGFIPMAYAEITASSRAAAAREIITMTYDNYDNHKGPGELDYDDPLMPAIIAYWDNTGSDEMTYDEFKKWCDEVESRNPEFVSLFRAGVTEDGPWRAFGELKVETAIPVVDPEETLVSGVTVTASELLKVAPGGPGWEEGAFPPNVAGAGWIDKFVDASGNPTWYRHTSHQNTMWAAYTPILPEAGRYVIETFVPGNHASTREARYFIVHHENGQHVETEASVEQRIYFDKWIPLATLDLDPANEDAGRVNEVDITSDSDPKEIAFSAVRWRLIPEGGPGFDPPIGTEAERAGAKVWPGRWEDANQFGHKYELGYHTGADLNLNKPTHNLDKGKPVYAAADGQVIYARELGGAWQSLVVIKHDPLPDDKPVYTRYGHMDDFIAEGTFVTRGQQIGKVGRYQEPTHPKSNFHLHFDVSRTNVLETNPQHWPGNSQSELFTHYVDPKEFILAHRP